MFKNKSIIIIIFLVAISLVTAQENQLLKAMKNELNRSFQGLKKAGKEPLYFLQYEINDEDIITLSASYGMTTSNNHDNNRYLSVDTRVGSYKLDNTHQLRGGSGGFDFYSPSSSQIPIDNDEYAIREVLWKATDAEFKRAQERIMKVISEKETKVTEEDTSADFSKAPKEIYNSNEAKASIDTILWLSRIKELSKIFKSYPWIYNSFITVTARGNTQYLVNTDGTEIVDGVNRYRVSIYADTKADDGMSLYLFRPFFSFNEAGLPSAEVLRTAIVTLINDLSALRTAPLVEPYSGPAILENRAAAVYFHEIFGHRIEGHRQKLEREGQTFKDKVGTQILPDFLSIYDDPTNENYLGQDLNGFYKYDDEGVKTQRVTVVENGTLKNFLMSRSPIQGFSSSNGHGRRASGYKVVSRQGNLIVESTHQVSYDSLKKLLIAECKKQNKPYGLIFKDIAGGFTATGRGGTQAFNVTPLLVQRVYQDGHEEVVRGVNVVGTPLVSFSKILTTSDDNAIFNGTCGAESGMIPVSCVSPSILTTEMEVEKKVKEQEKLPILPCPTGGAK
jgi:predicted Zn-dependent protease